MSRQVWFHQRLADGETPAGCTVSRQEKLPDGDFRITEYEWPLATLWFVDSDKFTSDERQAAYVAYAHSGYRQGVPQ
jgi:hypothetical protein